MNKRLLSICIPTYNREIYLEKLLSTITLQSEFYNSENIEIVINDGPSTDNTTKLIQELQLIHGSKIRYFRNNVAVGLCSALLESIEFSGGEYTWLIGSDDLLTNVSLKVIIDVIQNDKPGIIFSDRYDFYGGIVSGNFHTHTNKKNIIINGIDEFISYLGNSERNNWHGNTHYFTFMSIFCFRQDLYLRNKKLLLADSLIHNEIKLKSNYFNYVIILFYNIFNENIVLIKSTTLVLARMGNTSWSHNGLTIVKDLYLVIRCFLKQYRVTFKCRLFFFYTLLIWLIPGLGSIIKNNPLLKYFYKPISAMIIFLFYRRNKSKK